MSKKHPLHNNISQVHEALFIICSLISLCILFTYLYRIPEQLRRDSHTRLSITLQESSAPAHSEIYTTSKIQQLNADPFAHIK